jgi:uncharacterized protein YkwD
MRRVALLGVVLAVAPAAAAVAAPRCAGSDVIPTAASLVAGSQATLCEVNAQRTEHGLRELVPSSVLDAASIAYSQRMVGESFFSHVAPDGTDLVRRLVGVRYIPAGRWWVVGENIAWATGALSTPEGVVAAWMASPGHRANILSADYGEMGVGVALGTPLDRADGATVTTDFGTVSDAAPQAPAKSEPEAAARRVPSGARRCSRTRLRRQATGRAVGAADARRCNARAGARGRAHPRASRGVRASSRRDGVDVGAHD